MAGLHVTTAALGRASRAALDTQIERLKGGDRLKPVTVVPPNTLSALSLRRALGLRPGGLVNVQFLVLPRLIEFIGSPELARHERRPLSQAFRIEAIRAVVSETREAFLGDLPLEGPALRSIDAAFADFDQCDADALNRIAANSERQRYLVDRYREFRDRISTFYDERDLTDAAANALNRGPLSVLRDIGDVILYLPHDLTLQQRSFLDALAERVGVAVIVGLSGDPDGDTHALAQWPLPPEGVLVNSPPIAERILQAPDAEEEIRDAIRQLGERAGNGQPLHRTAILYAQRDPYQRIAAEQLDAAGIPWNGRLPITYGQTIAGRTLLSLLQIAARAAQKPVRISWAEIVAPWLSGAPILDANNQVIPSARWNQLARKANLLRDPEQWLERLHQYRTKLTQEHDRLHADADDELPWRIIALRHNLAELTGFEAFVQELVDLIRAIEPSASWSSHTQRAERLLERYLGSRTTFANHVTGHAQPSADRSSPSPPPTPSSFPRRETFAKARSARSSPDSLSLWERAGVRAGRRSLSGGGPALRQWRSPHPNPLPEGEGTDGFRKGLRRRESTRNSEGNLDSRLRGNDGNGTLDRELNAWDTIHDQLRALAQLDELGATDPARFLAAVERALDRPAGRVGRFGTGVFVGSLADAAGANWDLAFVVGAAERSLPPAQREDPLLPEALRSAVGLNGAADRSRRRRSEYLAALCSADERQLSYPRADVRGQRARLPSRWLLESATALHGERVYGSKIDRLSGDGWFHAAPSFEWAIQNAPTPGTIQEYDLRSLRRAAAPQRHFLALDHLPLQRGFALQQARRHPSFGPWDGRIDADTTSYAQRPHSPTALQDWAVCPYRYFLGRVLKVAERDEAEEELSISALEKGALIHDILDEFFKAMGPLQSPREAWSGRHRRKLDELANEKLDAAEKRGITGRKLLWTRERELIRNDLQTLLSRDNERRAERQVVQIASEFEFGLGGDPPVRVKLSGGRVVELRGKIDRIDRSEDGSRVDVIDYKTGITMPAKKTLAADVTIAGQYLQLPVYGAAAREHLADSSAAEVSTAYWYITERARFALREVEWTEKNEVRFNEVLGRIMDGIGSGLFPAHPGDDGYGSPKNCRTCPYDAVCSRDRQYDWRATKHDRRLAAYVDLVEGSPP